MWWRKNVSQKYWWCYFNFYAHALYIKTFLLSICWRRPHLSLLHHLTDDTYKQTKKWANLFQETIAFCVTEVFSIRIQTNKFSFFFRSSPIISCFNRRKKNYSYCVIYWIYEQKKSLIVSPSTMKGNIL